MQKSSLKEICFINIKSYDDLLVILLLTLFSKLLSLNHLHGTILEAADQLVFAETSAYYLSVWSIASRCLEGKPEKSNALTHFRLTWPSRRGAIK